MERVRENLAYELQPRPQRCALWCSIATCWVAVSIGCTREVASRTPSARGEAISFSYSVPGSSQRVDSQSTRGRATVLLMMTTYDLASQLMAKRLGELVRSARPRSNAVAVALEPPSYEHLLPAYAATLELPYPVAIADFATLSGTGPLGVVDHVPVLVFLNEHGVETGRLRGEQSMAELERALRDAQESEQR